MKSYIPYGINEYKDEILNNIDAKRNDDVNDMINNNIFDIQEMDFANCYTNFSDYGLLIDLLVQPRTYYDKATGTNITTEETSLNNVVYFKTKKDKRYRKDQTFRENKVIENRFSSNKAEYRADMNFKAFDRSRFILIIDGHIRNDDAGFTCLDGFVYFRFRQEQKFTTAILVELMNYNTVVLRNPVRNGHNSTLVDLVGSEYNSYKMDIIDDSGEVDPTKVTETADGWNIDASYVSSGDTLLFAFEDDTNVIDYKWKKLTKGRYIVPKNEKYYTMDTLAHDGVKYYIGRITYINDRVIEVPNTILLPYKHNDRLEERHTSNLEDVTYDITNVPIKPMLVEPDIYNHDTSLGEYIKLNNDPNSLLLNKMYGYNRYGYDETEVRGSVNHVIDYSKPFNLEYRLKPINTPIVRSILGKVPAGIKIYTISDYNDEIKPTIYFKEISSVDRRVTVTYTLEDADDVFTHGEITLLDYNDIDTNHIHQAIAKGTHTFSFDAPNDGAFSLHYDLQSSVGENFDTSNSFIVNTKIDVSISIDKIATNELEVTTDITIRDIDHLFASGVLEILDVHKNVIGSRPIKISDTGHNFNLSKFGTYYIRYHLKATGRPDVIVESRAIVLSAIDTSVVHIKAVPIINDVVATFNVNTITVDYGYDDPDDTYSSAIMTVSDGIGTFHLKKFANTIDIPVPAHINKTVTVTYTIIDSSNHKITKSTTVPVNTDSLLTINNIITKINQHSMNLSFNIDDPDGSFMSGTVTGDHGIATKTIAKSGQVSIDYPLPTIDETITLKILIITNIGPVLEHAKFNVIVSNNPPVVTLFKETLTNNILTVEYEYSDVSDVVTGGQITLSNNMGTTSFTAKAGKVTFVIPTRIHRTITTHIILTTREGTHVSKQLTFTVDTRIPYEVQNISGSVDKHNVKLDKVIIIDNDIPYSETSFKAELLDYNRQPLVPEVTKDVGITEVGTVFPNIASGRYVIKVDVGGQIKYTPILTVTPQDYTLDKPTITLSGRDLIISNVILHDTDNAYHQNNITLEVTDINGKSLTPHKSASIPKTTTTHTFTMTNYGIYKVKVTAGNKVAFTDSVEIEKADYAIKTPYVTQNGYTVGVSNLGIIDPEGKFTGTTYTVEVLRDTGEQLTPRLIKTVPIGHTSTSFTIPTYGTFQFEVHIGDKRVSSTVFTTDKRQHTVNKPKLVLHNRNLYVSNLGIVDQDDYFNGSIYTVELVKLDNGVESTSDSKSIVISQSTTSFEITHSGEYFVRVIAGVSHSDSDHITVAHKDATIESIEIITLSNKLTAYDLKFTAYDDVIDTNTLVFDVDLQDLSGNSIGVTGSFLYRDNTITLTAPAFPANLNSISYKLKIYSKMYPLIDPYYKVFKLTKTTPRLTINHDSYDDGNVVPINVIIEDTDNYILNNRIDVSLTKQDNTIKYDTTFTLDNRTLFIVLPEGIYDGTYTIDGTKYNNTLEVTKKTIRLPMHVSEIPLIDIRDYIYTNKYVGKHAIVLNDLQFTDTNDLTIDLLDVNGSPVIEAMVSKEGTAMEIEAPIGLYKLRFNQYGKSYISNTFIIN